MSVTQVATRRVGKPREKMSPRSRRHPDLNFRLLEIMDERGLTYTDLSRMTGIPASTLSDMGRGLIAVPGSDHIVVLCRSLSISVGELLQLRPKNNTEITSKSLT